MQTLKRIVWAVLRFLFALLLATLAATVLASFMQTQNLISRLNGVGADIGIGARLGTAVYDLRHFAPQYFLGILAGFLVAFLVGLLLYRLAKFGRPVVFAVAGAAAILAFLLGSKEAFFGVQLVGGARDLVGLLFQLLAGAIGGLIFARLTRPRDRRVR